MDEGIGMNEYLATPMTNSASKQAVKTQHKTLIITLSKLATPPPSDLRT